MSYYLGKSVLATVTYYDVLDMPLTAFEIWKHLIVRESSQQESEQANNLSDIFRLLASGTLVDRIDEQNGFYFLRRRDGLVARRIRTEKISVGKLKRIRRLARVLAYIPYLRLLGATGSLAMKNGARTSDWDMFVVLRSGKIWTGRTLLTGFLHFVGKRRHQDKIQDRVCLNYFVTDDNLEIGTKDLFSAHEYHFFIPLLNFHLFQIFELKNRWIQKYCPNFAPTTLPCLWTLQASVSVRYVQKKLESLFDLLNLERWLASWQKAKIIRNPKTSITGSLIEASNRALIFLPYPRGPRVFQKFKERLNISLPQDSGSL
jgi:hypothetical protein